MAGLFFAFSAFEMETLGRLPPPQGIAAMQSINVAILNPIFFVVFFGTAAICLLLAVWSIVRWSDSGAAWLLGGSVLYLVGTILVTIVVNVPMDDALAAVDPASEEGAMGRVPDRLDALESYPHHRVPCRDGRAHRGAPFPGPVRRRGVTPQHDNACETRALLIDPAHAVRL